LFESKEWVTRERERRGRSNIKHHKRIAGKIACSQLDDNY
jgi:hypothetical protein